MSSHCRRESATRTLRELYDLQQLPYLKLFRAHLASSYDREGGNYDFGNYERIERGQGVLLQAQGSGMITRIWSANAKGRLRIYVDGRSAPVVDESFPEFLKNAPMSWGEGVNSYKHAAGKPLGYTAYRAIPFRKEIKATITPAHDDLYYQINYLTFHAKDDLPPGEEILGSTERAAHESIFGDFDFSRSSVAGAGHKVVKDRIRLKAGEKRPLFEIQECSRILGVSVKLSYSSDRLTREHQKRNLLLRAYWDDDVYGADGHLVNPAPSVASPLAYFFLDFDQADSLNSVFTRFRRSADGVRHQYACRFPMPFRNYAKIVLVNDAATDYSDIEYEILYQSEPKWEESACHFKAAFHEETNAFGYDLGNYRDRVMYLRNRDGRDNYSLLRAFGKGHFIGCGMHIDYGETPFICALVEADEAVFVDRDPALTMWGTGTEDYFNDAWGVGDYQRPLSGLTDRDKRIFGYRFHLADCIPFQEKIDFTFEHGSSNNCSASYRSIAFYYKRPEVPDFSCRPGAEMDEEYGVDRKLVRSADRNMDRYFEL